LLAPHSLLGDFTVSEGHEYPLVYLYNILGFVWWWSSFPSIRPIIHPSNFLIRKKKMMEEEEDENGSSKLKISN
jgi:hypothetical protein